MMIFKTLYPSVTSTLLEKKQNVATTSRGLQLIAYYLKYSTIQLPK